MAPVVLTIALAFAAFVAGRLILGRRRRRRRYPPVAGTILQQLLNFHRFSEFHADLARKHHTFRMLAPTWSNVYTVDPANVEHILKNNFANYGKGEFTYEVFKDLLGDGIFAVDGEKWRQQRKIASFVFSTRMLRDYSSGVFRATAERLAGVVAAAAAGRIDMQELLMKATLDSIFQTALGVELNSLAGAGAGTAAAFAAAFDAASGQLVLRYLDMAWKVKKALNVGKEKAMRNNIRVIDGLVYGIIDKRTSEHSLPELEKKGDIVSRFLEERERNPDAGIDRKYLRDIMLNFILAGRDTSAGTLSWLLYCLCRHPEAQEKAAAEAAAAAAGLTEEDLHRMHYLHAALTETLRLYPAVPVDVKCCVADDTLPDGLEIKKGDLVNYVPYAMGRMEFLWGADAEEFRPERWLDGDGVFATASPFKFTAFQAGPRVCLGKEFAYRQMKIVAAVLLRRFRFELWDEAAPVKCRTMLTLHVDGGLHVRAMPRAAAVELE